MINRAGVRKLIPTAAFFQDKSIIFQCVGCRAIVASSRNIEEVYLACIESEKEDLMNVIFSSDAAKIGPGACLFVDESEVHVSQSAADELFDLYCVYSLVRCCGCKKPIGRFYTSTTEELDLIKDKLHIREESVLVYALESNSYISPREFFFSEFFAASKGGASKASEREKNSKTSGAPGKRGVFQESFTEEGCSMEATDAGELGSAMEIFKELSTILEVFGRSLNDLHERSSRTERIVKEMKEFWDFHMQTEKR